MYGYIKRSHSIHMLSIQIDTKSHLPSVQQHQIVLLCKPYEMEFSIMYGYQILQRSIIYWGKSALRQRLFEASSSSHSHASIASSILLKLIRVLQYVRIRPQTRVRIVECHLSSCCGLKLNFDYKGLLCCFWKVSCFCCATLNIFDHSEASGLSKKRRAFRLKDWKASIQSVEKGTRNEA